MDPIETFELDCRQEIEEQAEDGQLQSLTKKWRDATVASKYNYHFRTFGVPIIQYPQDMVAIQELIWAVRPSLIIETGIAHGGSLIMSAGMLAMLDYTDAAQGSGRLELKESHRRVIGIDIDIRAHNRAAIAQHPLSHKIEMVQGSSIAPDIIEEVRGKVLPDDRIMVFLDSNHTHDHVLAELEAYAPLTTTGSYCVVFDTVIEDLPANSFGSRPWNRGNNPKTAVNEYLRFIENGSRLGMDGSRLRFEIDRTIEKKLLVTVAPDGYLRRIE